MGVASALFFSFDSQDETLHRRITPTDEQFEFQQSSWNDLAEHLRVDMREKSGLSTATWLQGSYKFATQVRPARKGDEFDIDLGFYFLWNGEASDGSHTPQQLRQFIHNSLKDYADGVDDVRKVADPKPRCCRIHYDQDFHVDVPCYHLDDTRDTRRLATDTGWEASDPKALYKWFQDQFEEADRARLRRQIRYVKTWAALKCAANDGRPSSVVLTVLVSEAMLGLTKGERRLADDNLIKLLLGRVSGRLNKSMAVPNPVAPSENMNRLTEGQGIAFRRTTRVS